MVTLDPANALARHADTRLRYGRIAAGVVKSTCMFGLRNREDPARQYHAH